VGFRGGQRNGHGKKEVQVSWIGPDPIRQLPIQKSNAPYFFTRYTLYIIFLFTMSYGFCQSQILYDLTK
jgi:hypothetical protein